MTLTTWQTELHTLAPGIHAYIQASGGFMISNAGLVSGQAADVAIDALFAPRMTRGFLDEAARVSEAPIATLINTHHHIDHTLGNAAFEGKTIIAHELTRGEMRRSGDIAALRARIPQIAPQFIEDVAEARAVVLPNVAYAERLTLYVDDTEIQLLHVPTAHTIDDTLVYLPAHKLLYAGDLAFFFVTPLAFEGSVLGWLNALATIESMDVERIVPGHGPVGTLDDLALLRGYFETLRDQARRHFDAGDPAAIAVRTIDLGPYAEWAEPERIAPNVLRLYEDFAGAPWAPLQIEAVRAAQAAWQAERA